MKSLWKSLWMVCALAGALTVAAGCGPQQAYCPNTGVNGGSSCPIAGNDAQTQQQEAGSACPAGEKPGIDPTTHMLICVPD